MTQRGQNLRAAGGGARPRIGSRAKDAGAASASLASGSAVRLGRRPGVSVTSDIILDAAEQAFALGGYDGTSLRQICEKAKVNPALVHHYFGSKEGLFTAIFRRRAHELAQARLARLDALERRLGKKPTLDEIVHAFLFPAVELKRRGAGGIAFLRIIARLQNEPPEATLTLRTQVYDEPMQRYVAALRRVLPEIDPLAIYWRMVFMVGAYVYTLADFHRLDTLSLGRCDSKDIDESFRQLLSFFVGGLKAPLLERPR